MFPISRVIYHTKAYQNRQKNVQEVVHVLTDVYAGKLFNTENY